MFLSRLQETRPGRHFEAFILDGGYFAWEKHVRFSGEEDDFLKTRWTLQELSDSISTTADDLPSLAALQCQAPAPREAPTKLRERVKAPPPITAERQACVTMTALDLPPAAALLEDSEGEEGLPSFE